MILVQSQTGIHNEVLRQSHITYFGRGLGIGADQKHLEQNLGADGARQTNGSRCKAASFG
jgi:hypothetical protein